MRFLISLLTLSGILLLGTASSSATPIKVDLKKLLDQAENSRPYQYMPARVGWNGPEEPTFTPSRAIRLQDVEARQWLVWLAIPDPRMVVAFAAAILGIRLIRRGREGRPNPAIA